jgi:hypothetical protein
LAFEKGVLAFENGDLTNRQSNKQTYIGPGGDRDEVKLEWKLKLSTCLHETGTKITKFSIYSPYQAIFFFRWLLLACIVPNVKVTAETGLKCICDYIHPSLNSCRSEVSQRLFNL